MEYPGVMVECKWDDDSSSCSGVLLCNNYILTHGSLLYSILKKNYDISSVEFSTKLFQDSIDLILSAHYAVYINDNKGLNGKNCENGKLNLDTFKSSNLLNESRLQNYSNGKFSCLEIYPEMIFIDKNLGREITQIFGASDGWRFSEENFHTNMGEIHILSSFLIFRIRQSDCLLNCLTRAANLSLCPEKGDLLLIDSCPFGNISPEMFLSSFTQGIVSNCNSSHSLFTTDARCVLGGEGAPVYTKNREFHLSGIVLAPFSWLNGEWLGLTLVVSTKIILNRIVTGMEEGLTNSILFFSEIQTSGIFRNIHEAEIEDKKETIIINPSIVSMKQNDFRYLDTELVSSGIDLSKNARFKDYTKRIIDSTVAIICGDSSRGYNWGSGVGVNTQQGIIITCSHLTMYARNKIVTIVDSNGKKCKGKVIFETKPLHVENKMTKDRFDSNLNQIKNFDLWDLAVVISENGFKSYLPLADKIPIKGSPVFLCGYGLFDIYRSDFSSSLSAGIISKINFQSSEHESFKEQNPSLDVKYVSDNRNFLTNLIAPEFWIHGACDGVNQLVAVQSSCSVYEGNSGGPLVAMHETIGPVIVGIMVCSAKNHESRGSFPQINMAVPACGIANAIERFSTSGDIRDLSPLSIKSKRKGLLWNQELKEKSKL